MSSEKALALILKTVDFSETSLVVTLFTREFGKVRGLAKGGRRLKGPFESALDLLSLCRIVFLRKSSEALDLLTEARLERCFRPAGRDLLARYAGYYVAELLAGLTDDGDPHPEIFDAACETLAALGRSDAPLHRHVLRFELTTLHWLGHLPALTACVECGEPVPQTPRVPFSLSGGGVLCGRCRPGQRQVVSVSAEVLTALGVFAQPDTEAWREQALSKAAAGELRGLINNYVTHVLGQKPRLHAWLAALREA